MRALSFLARLIILLIAIFFSMENRDLVEIGIWPIDMRIAMPIFLPILAVLALGFLLGWGRAWMKFGHTRRQLRKALRDLRDADLELGRLKEQLKSLNNSNIPQIGSNSG